MCPPLHQGGGATAHRHHRNPAEAWRRWRGEEGANQGQASVSTCTFCSTEKSSAKSRPAAGVRPSASITVQPKAPLLLGPGPGQRASELCEAEIGRRGAVKNR